MTIAKLSVLHKHKKWTESKAKQLKTILIIHHSWYAGKKKYKRDM